MRIGVSAALLLCLTPSALAAGPPIYIWLEPEWFAGVEGSFSYWTGTAKPAGTWGVAGPGVSPEWTQGGESEWNSVGAPAEETKATCHREFTIPRAGRYKIWVRYVDHRRKSEPFRVAVNQGGKAVLDGEFGVRNVVPANDEYQLYWGFSFTWDSVEGSMAEGPARLALTIDKAGEGWRQVDAILLTDDLTYTPVGREKPPFAYLSGFQVRPKNGAAWRGAFLSKPMQSKRPPLGGRDFSMWTGIGTDAAWWKQQNVETLTPYDVLFQFGPPPDIREKFHKQFAGRRDLPVLSWPHLRPGLYLGETPDLSPGTPIRLWLERTKTPFYVLTNYSDARYTDATGPATYQALTGPLADQFLGYIHGEAVGSPSVSIPERALNADRRAHVDALGRDLVQQQAAAWSRVYKSAVPADHWSKGIACLSVESSALAHLYHETGAKTVGYEVDATMPNVPLRVAFQRGAARQYGGTWINYASGNFGDACNAFGQAPVVPRGAPGWFHSKYAITDGVTASWYSKLYYLNYLGGASAIFWEQFLHNQWILPGPGQHPVQLSPFGRATEEFHAFVDRLTDRGEPITPIAILLNHAHGFERSSFKCKVLHVFPENRTDLELRELFDVCWHPARIVEGQPAAPDVQSLPNGMYGNIFDVLVDRPARAKAILNYPILWAAGDVDLSGPWPQLLRDYVEQGGTLVLSANAARKKLPGALLGFALTGTFDRAEQWLDEDAVSRPCTPYQFERGQLLGAKPLAWARPGIPLITRHAVGQGAVILTLIPGLMGEDERAHPALPYLINGLTEKLLPVEVRRADGGSLTGEILYQVNRTSNGFVVLLMNNRGVDKTQSGVARVDRRASVSVVIRTQQRIRSARELTEPRDLPTAPASGATEIRLTIPAGDLKVLVLLD